MIDPISEEIERPLRTSIAAISSVAKLAELKDSCKVALKAVQDELAVARVYYEKLSDLETRGAMKLNAIDEKVAAFKSSKNLTFNVWYKTGQNEYHDGSCELFFPTGTTSAGRVRGVSIRCDPVGGRGHGYEMFQCKLDHPYKREEQWPDPYTGEYQFAVDRKTINAKTFEQMSKLTTLMIFGTNVERAFPVMIAHRDQQEKYFYAQYGLQDGEVVLIQGRWDVK